ncbi:MAG: metallophosphoesterase family protein [Candidatus Hadarchaeales archaeon]
MRILAVADFHSDPNAETRFLKKIAGGYDCIVIIGDLTQFGPPEVVESMLEQVKSAGVPAFAVPGNCDPKQIVQVLEKFGVNLHRKCERIGDIAFLGLGGSNMTPFNTPFELTEGEIAEELASLSCGGSEKMVLITHAPPYGTKVDEIKAGTHVGSKSIRAYIETRQPILVLCGHVHEGRGVDEIGRTVIVNPGPATMGNAAEVQISDNGRVTVDLIQL